MLSIINIESVNHVLLSHQLIKKLKMELLQPPKELLHKKRTNLSLQHLLPLPITAGLVHPEALLGNLLQHLFAPSQLFLIVSL